VAADRDVVRAEAPERVLGLPDLAEVEPVRVDVVDLAELAGSTISFSFPTPGWYSRRCPVIKIKPAADAAAATSAASFDD
jgi:hypothetical protein